jgi:hypothetical protein
VSCTLKLPKWPWARWRLCDFIRGPQQQDKEVSDEVDHDINKGYQTSMSTMGENKEKKNLKKHQASVLPTSARLISLSVFSFRIF